MGQEYGHVLAESSVLGPLTSCNQGVSWDCAHLKVHVGKHLIPNSLVLLLAQVSSSSIIGLKDSDPC